MIRLEDFHYTGVPRLGTVIISRTALKELEEAGVGPQLLGEALEHGTDIRHRKHHNVLGRQYRDIRLVIRTYTTEGAAAVCVNGYRVKP
jgi:hypothetical protein